MSSIQAKLFIFTFILVGSIILLSFISSRRIKKIDIHRALLYVSAVAMIGVTGEIFVGTLYSHYFHTPLWRYNFMPVHHAYTSSYAPILWGAFGFYIYIFHNKYEKWTRAELTKLSVIFGFEALILEALADLISRPVLGNYIYYYYPGNLWHITALQTFPFYFLCGGLIIRTIHWFKQNPRFFTILSTWITVVTIYFK